MKVFLSFVFTLQLSAYEDWPTEGWHPRTLEEAGIDEQRFAKFVHYSFNGTGEEGHRFQTNALVVVKDGYLVYDGYDHGFTRENKQLLFSIGKSIMGTLVGIAQSQGLISIAQPVAIYVGLDRDHIRKEMKVGHLLQMSSGIDWQEAYKDKNDILKSNVLQVHYGKGRKDFVEYILELPMANDPGRAFNYSTGDALLLGHLLASAVGGSDELLQYADQELWYPLGVRDYTIERDRRGNLYGGSYFYMTPRDLAKFGLLHLHRGTWDGEEVYPAYWYDYITMIPPSWGQGPSEGKDEHIGIHTAQWWLNREDPYTGKPRALQAVPEDALMAQGHGGQLLMIVPSLGLIVVRIGWDIKDSIDYNRDYNKMMELLIGSLR